MFSFPVSLLLGVTGIIFDRTKWLAVISTLCAGTPLLFFLFNVVLQ